MRGGGEADPAAQRVVGDEDEEEEALARAAASERTAKGTGHSGPALAGYKPAKPKKIREAPVGDEDWDEKIGNLMERFRFRRIWQRRCYWIPTATLARQ